jgi:GntR family transcriptional repressor for pyruvate dehydrogenase complex
MSKAQPSHRFERPLEVGPPLGRRGATSTPAAVVDMLRRHIVASPSGAYLGSEGELLERLGVSSPTLRQAARLLEQQQLLKVVRGSRGGYFGRRPDVSATARAAAVFLEASQATLADARAAARPLMIEAAKLAAAMINEPGRRALAETLQADKANEPTQPLEALFSLDESLVKETLTLCGNPVIELIALVVDSLGALKQPRSRMFEEHPDRIAVWRRQLWRTGDAILDGDADLAALLIRRSYMLSDAWLPSQDDGKAEIVRAPNWLSAKKNSVVEEAADKLRAMILNNPPGALLGREESLAAQLQVSRQTLRQAAAIAQHDNLLEIRRGVNGGYAGRRPDMGQVVETAALYFELNGVTLRHLMSASQALAAEACRMAPSYAGGEYEPVLHGVLDTLNSVDTTSDADPFRSIFRAEQTFMDAVLRFGNNAVITLFVRCCYKYGSWVDQPVQTGIDRIHAWRDARVKAVEALLARDGEAAAVISNRVIIMMDGWMAPRSTPVSSRA